MIWKETIHISRQQRTGLVGLKNGHFANVQYCIYDDSTPLVGGSEKAQNYADVIYAMDDPKGLSKILLLYWVHQFFESFFKRYPTFTHTI